MKVAAINSNSDFSLSAIPENNILLFVGTDENNEPVLKYKDSAGEFHTFSVNTPVSSDTSDTSDTSISSDSSIDPNLLPENIKYNVTIEGITGTFTGDGDATSSDVLSGKKAYVKGSLVTGNIQTVQATLSANVVTVPAGYVAAPQTLTVPEAGAITTSVLTVTVPVGYIASARTVTLTDANLSAANIKDGVSIFGVTGTYTYGATATADKILAGYTAYANGQMLTGTYSPEVSSSSDSSDAPAGECPFDLVKVTAYQNYREGFTANMTIVLSNFPTPAEEWDPDFSSYNGTYEVTDETAEEPNWRNRVYKKGSYTLRYKIYDPEEDWMQSGNYWSLGSSTYTEMWIESNSDIASGQLSWTSDMYGNLNCTAVCTTQTFPTIPQQFTGVRAIAYNSTTTLFSFDSTPVTLTGFETTPLQHMVYAAYGTSLIADPIRSGITPLDVVFYLNPALYQFQDVASGITGKPSKRGMISNGKFVFDGSSYITFDTSTAPALNLGYNDCTIEWFSKTTVERTTSYPAEITNGANSWTTGTFTPVRYHNGANTRNYTCYWYPGDPLINGANDYAIGTQRHLAFVRSGNTAKIFVDGVLEGTGDCTGYYINFLAWNILRLGWGEWDGSDGWFTGEIGELKITKRALYSQNFTPPQTLL